MAFKVKDLLISVLPSEGEAEQGQADCPTCGMCSAGVTFVPHPFCDMGSVPTRHPTTLLELLWCRAHGATECYLATTLTNLWSLLCAPCAVLVSIDPTVAGVNATAQLATLKAHLRQALAEIEQREKAAEQAAQPQTPEQIDELQQKMREAMAELDRRRKDLQKPDRPKK